MRKLSHSEISQNRSTIENIPSVDRLPIVVVINSVRSAYNVGSIFRTSDGAMIEKLYLCGYTPHPPQKEVLKTALGSQDSVSWEYENDPHNIIKKYKSIGYKIAALELTEESTTYYEMDSNQFPICLIIGNEITGVQQDLLDECDFTLEIPQYGIKQSLNVAVAYGISIFDLRRIYDVKKAKEQK